MVGRSIDSIEGVKDSPTEMAKETGVSISAKTEEAQSRLIRAARRKRQDGSFPTVAETIV